MGLISWLVFGFVAGSLAGMATGNRREGCLTKIAIGVLGALIGGSLARAAGADVSFHQFTWTGLLIAIVGSALLLLVLQALGVGGRRSPRRIR